MANKKMKKIKLHSTITSALNQAKESIDGLKLLEKGKLLKFSNFFKQKRVVNEKILSGLRNLGVATQDELGALEFKIKKLEGSLAEKNKASKARHKN